MALNKISDGKKHKFDPDSIIGDIAIHDRPPHAGQRMYNALQFVIKEQIACRVPKKYRSKVIHGRVCANTYSENVVEQLGYDFWFYLPAWTQKQGGRND